jgi:hypothetical protein
LRLRPVEEIESDAPLSYEALLLRYSREPFVAPETKPRSPFSRASFGALGAFAEDELANFIVHDVLRAGVGASTVPGQVLIKRLRYSDVDLQHVRLEGECPSFCPIRVKANESLMLGRRSGKRAPGPAHHGDLISQMEATAKSNATYAKRARTSETKRSAPSVASAAPAQNASDFVKMLGVQPGDLHLSSAEVEATYGGVLEAADAADIFEATSMWEKEVQAEEGEQWPSFQDALSEGSETELEPGEPDGLTTSVAAGGASSSSAAGPAVAPSNPKEWQWQGLGLHQISPWRYRDLHGSRQGQEVAVLHQVSPTSLKATCKYHTCGRSRCVLWLSNVKDAAATERDLVHWIAAGREVPVSRHQELARDVKLRYGMRV